MIFQFCLFGFIALTLGQEVKEKGNIDDLIKDVFTKPQNEERTDAQNEKVSVLLVLSGRILNSVTCYSLAMAVQENACLIIFVSMEP